VAAFFGFSKQSETPRPSIGGTTAIRQAKEKQPNHEDTKNWLPSGGCRNIEDLLRTFYFVDDLASPTSFVIPDTCSHSGSLYFVPTGGKDRYRLQARREDNTLWRNIHNSPAEFVIAILQDPERTHLTLSFDRLIVSIQHAASQECPTYDSSWMPWRSHDIAVYTHLADQEEAGKQHEADLAQPGILLFRANNSSEECAGEPRKSIIVFVVGETPTSGVDKKQFLSAKSWVETLSPSSSSMLHILGPTSSGSFSSLAGLLNDIPAEVSTGTTNARSLINDFQSTLHLQVDDFNEDDAAEIGRFFCTLRHDGYDLAKVAILSEDETAFGESKPNDLSAKQATNLVIHQGRRPGFG
jgi:hypothetical protein